MDVLPVMTVPRSLPTDLKQRLLRCAVTALRDAGATDVATTVTASELVVEADVS